MSQALQGPLPGEEAQRCMAPDGRRNQPPHDQRTRQSAVLALIHRSVGGLSLPFTLRPTSLGHHGGEISLPGGGIEPHDETLMETALRETEEELGIPTSGVTVLGNLTPLYIAPSRNMVHPYIGWIPNLPTLDPDPREVEAVLTVPLAQLLDRGNLDVHLWNRGGRQRTAPCYRMNGICIWGATAMILSELLTVIRSTVSLPIP